MWTKPVETSSNGFSATRVSSKRPTKISVPVSLASEQWRYAVQDMSQNFTQSVSMTRLSLCLKIQTRKKKFNKIFTPPDLSEDSSVCTPPLRHVQSKITNRGRLGVSHLLSQDSNLNSPAVFANSLDSHVEPSVKQWVTRCQNGRASRAMASVSSQVAKQFILSQVNHKDEDVVSEVNSDRSPIAESPREDSLFGDESNQGEIPEGDSYEYSQDESSSVSFRSEREENSASFENEGYYDEERPPEQETKEAVLEALYQNKIRTQENMEVADLFRLRSLFLAWQNAVDAMVMDEGPHSAKVFQIKKAHSMQSARKVRLVASSNTKGSFSPSTMSHLNQRTAIWKYIKAGTSLERHQREYEAKRKAIDKRWANQFFWMKLQEEIIHSEFKCVKYNYAMDSKVQNFGSQVARLRFDNLGNSLVLKNLKLVDQMKYVLEADPQQIDKARAELKQRKLEEKQQQAEKKKVVRSLNNSRMSADLDSSLLPPELRDFADQQEAEEEASSDDDLDPLQQYKEERSSASCEVADIENITFGAFSSRFWMLRKHLNCIPIKEGHPFHSWQCLSLSLDNRDIDLVIKSQKQRNKIILFLIFKMVTLDGRRASAEPMLKAMFEAGMERLRKELGTTDPANSHQSKLKISNQLSIARKCYLKYLICQFRQKISFLAFKKKCTITELFCKAILKSYDQLKQEGYVYQDRKKEKQDSLLFSSILSGFQVSSFFRNIIRMNAANIRGSDLLKKVEEQEANQSKVDDAMLAAKMKQILQMQKKNKVTDIFRFSTYECNNQTYRLFEDKSNTKFIREKRVRNQKSMAMSKIQLLLSLKCLKGPLYVKALLHKVELAKDLFVLDIEEGNEVFISSALSKSNLPMSFRFYDPIFLILQERVAEDKKEFLKLRNQLEKRIYYEVDTSKQFLEKMGFRETQNKDYQKLTFKYAALNQHVQQDINVEQSIFTMGIQRSNYMCVDEQLMKEIHENPSKAAELKKFKRKPKEGVEDTSANPENQVYFKYCHPREVNQKRQKQIHFLAQFQTKQIQLKNQSQKLILMDKLNNWLDDNLDAVVKTEALSGLAQFKKGVITSANKSQIGQLGLSTEKVRRLNSIDQLQDVSEQEAQKLADFYHKNQVKQKLMDILENIIIQRRKRVHCKKVGELQKAINPKKPFQQRMGFVTNAIERDIQWFEANSGSLEIYQIKAQLRKIMTK